MSNIRNQIQETSKKLNDWWEFTGNCNIVELINSISNKQIFWRWTQRFRRLRRWSGSGLRLLPTRSTIIVERASNATKQIETLVQTIQSDTKRSGGFNGTNNCWGGLMVRTCGERWWCSKPDWDWRVSNDLAGIDSEYFPNLATIGRCNKHIRTMNVIQEITTPKPLFGTQQTAESDLNLVELWMVRLSVQDF